MCSSCQFIYFTWLKTIQSFKECTIRILCSSSLEVIGIGNRLRQPQKKHNESESTKFCILTELLCSNLYTGKPRKNIPAEVTFPVFALSSCRRLPYVNWNHAQTITYLKETISVEQKEGCHTLNILFRYWIFLRI